jgi:hypothetical protein
MSWGQNDLVWHATELLIWHMHRNWATFVSNRSGSAPVLLRIGPNLHHFAREIRPRDRLTPKPDHFCFKPLRFCTGFTPNRSEFAPLGPGYPPPGQTRTETGPVQLQAPPISHRFYSEVVRIRTTSPGISAPGTDSHRNRTGLASNPSGLAPVLLRTGPNSHHFARNIRLRNRPAPRPDHSCFGPLRFCTGFAPNWSEYAPVQNPKGFLYSADACKTRFGLKGINSPQASSGPGM